MLTLFDTTLRDGAQTEGVTLTVDDKIRIARRLDELGIHYIEAGCPGANPKDDELFARAATGELNLKHAKLTAFGFTRRAGSTAGKDAIIKAMVASQAPVACIVAKSWDVHVTHALRTTLEENVAMVRDSVKYLRRHHDEVLLDCEHFFDGYKANPSYAVAVATAAAEAGAKYVVLCDTNGGCLPNEIGDIVATVREHGFAIGIHCHNDTDCGVANTMAAIAAGASHVQGTLNGLGERTGNARLASVIANLVLKLGLPVISTEQLVSLTETCHFVSEVCNVTPQPQQAYVGMSAFAHKGAVHASAIARRRDLYEHVEPELVGNLRHLVVSEMAGRATVELKARELGVELGEDLDVAKVIRTVKDLEHLGYHFEAADGSFELLLRRTSGWEHEFFTIESFRAIVEQRQDGTFSSEATVKLRANGERIISTAEGNGPVNALDAALRRALEASYPELEGIHLADYKVRILNEAAGTGATTRVLLTSSDGTHEWGTVGVSANIIEASWEALVDGYVYGLLRHNGSK